MTDRQKDTLAVIGGIGVITYIIGCLLRIMHWPGGYLFLYSGYILLAVSLCLLLFFIVKPKK